MPDAPRFTKSQIDRLGDRLRSNNPSSDDLRLLDAYRNSFREAYDEVINEIRRRIRIEPTGREKTNASIAEKLRRQTVRLSQIQDIVGCRIIVLDTVSQDHLVEELSPIFSKIKIDNLRQ